jgi:DNA-binding MarR family transcriptional regulator
MFFLKELPTRKMIDGYAQKYPIKKAGCIEAGLVMMRQASLLIRQLETYFAGEGTSQLKFLILIVIDREPGRNSLLASEVAERIDVSRPVMSRTLQVLLDQGLVAIADDDNDRRAKNVSLTAPGRKFLKKILPEYFKIIDDFMT